MLNTVIFMGLLSHIDDNEPLIRYVNIIGEYQNLEGKFNHDYIPVINWNKLNKGDLFTFQDQTCVIIKGRLEVYKNRFVVVCESLSYLHKN